jgi:excisionase family DNA binding protein
MKNLSPPVIEKDAIDIANYPTRPLSIEQVCEWAGVSRRFLELEIERGNLKVRRLSKRLIRIMPKDLAAWMERALTEVA